MAKPLNAEKFFAPLLQDCELEAQLRAQTLRKKNRLYFDWTASGLAFAPIEKRIQKLLPFYANTHSDANLYAQNIEKLYQTAKQKLKDALGLSADFALIATGYGASGAIKKFQELLGIYAPPHTLLRIQKPQKSHLPLVIVGAMEHHSNELSFREGLCEVVRIGLDAHGLVDLNALEAVLQQHKGREIIASFVSASNVTGILLDCERFSKLVRSYGGIVALDMASSSPYMNIPCELFDAAFFAPHKLLGGPGSCGLLAVRRALVDSSLPPSFAGGGSVAYSSRSAQYYLNDIETREEAGTPPVLQLLRAALAYRLREEISRTWIAARETELAQYFLQSVRDFAPLTLYGNQTAPKIGIFACNLKNLSPHYVSFLLAKRFHIDTRAGCSCAGPYAHDLLDMDDLDFVPAYKSGWVRVSLHYTHTKADIDLLVAALQSLVR